MPKKKKNTPDGAKSPEGAKSPKGTKHPEGERSSEEAKYPEGEMYPEGTAANVAAHLDNAAHLALIAKDKWGELVTITSVLAHSPFVTLAARLVVSQHQAMQIAARTLNCV